MKKSFLNILAGVIAAVALAIIVLPQNVLAAGEPQLSFTANWYNADGITFVLVQNNGSIGNSVNNYKWTVSEKAVDADTGLTVLDYSETRSVITDPIYVNTSKFRENAPVVLNVTVSCADLGYTYTSTYTIKNDKMVNGDFRIVASASNVLYSGATNNIINAYPEKMGALAESSIKAFLPYGYMIADEGVLSFNCGLDYNSKSGILCMQIPSGAQAANRVYKLMTIGQGGVINIYDDLDLNPATISANINFNGYAMALIYSENAAAPSVATTPAAGTVAAAPYTLIPNCYLQEAKQGDMCMRVFTAFTPYGYSAVKTYNVVLDNAVNNNTKNGAVTVAVTGAYTDYKLITVGAGSVQVLDDIDTNPATATFLLNFNGSAVQLIAK